MSEPLSDDEVFEIAEKLANGTATDEEVYRAKQEVQPWLGDDE
jgi:hypothetical protein